MLGKTISHYRVLETLGAGGMGVVYKAQDTRLGRFVALKFLPEEYADDRQLRERFHREARAASALNHPKICTIYDIGEENGRVFMAMEFMDGATLREVVQNNPLEIDRLTELAIQVANGLEAAHAEGILHRDIKPANIFVTRKNHAKILDFGLAKISTAGRKIQSDSDEALFETNYDSGGAALGTIAYMSPEQALGKALDARTDIFSFGVTLYQMSTARMPFHGDTSAATLLALMQETPLAPVRLNPDVPDGLERIINKCLEKDRNLRYQHASDVGADLKRLRQESAASGIRTITAVLQSARESGSGLWSTGCARSARYSSRNSMRCPTAPRWYSAPTASRARCRSRPSAARLNVFDATCPLVTKVHMEVTRYAREAREVFLIGHAGHPEVEGTIGQFDTSLGGSIYLVETAEDVANSSVKNPEHLAFVTQTTLSVDDTARSSMALQRALPGLKAPVKRRHLLRHAEPAGCGQGTGSTAATCWSWSAPSPARIRTDCARWPTRSGSPAIWSMGRNLHREWFDGQARWG